MRNLVLRNAITSTEISSSNFKYVMELVQGKNRREPYNSTWAVRDRPMQDEDSRSRQSIEKENSVIGLKQYSFRNIIILLLENETLHGCIYSNETIRKRPI
jgi:hypothetical protein